MRENYAELLRLADDGCPLVNDLDAYNIVDPGCSSFAIQVSAF